ncbi:TetR family transcriptional regulator [uncultured Jatrophihabitans sp.]|uniref:TetR family transcriptional regulator n=1 Tax=uncultured Jatrophihabitans sp. TaxID=1610747 RepID=UPI0035CBD27D
MVQSMRERKKAQTRDALIAAGIQLFAEHGFAAVTVADIAAAVDVSPRTFHRYFPDKVELLFAHDDEVLEIVRDALRQEPDGADPITVVRSVLAAITERLAGSHAELAIREQLLNQAAVLRDRNLAKRAAVEQLLAEHLAIRLRVAVDEDVRPRWWAGVAFATFTAGYQTWLAQGGELSAHLASAIRLLEPNPT